LLSSFSKFLIASAAVRLTALSFSGRNFFGTGSGTNGRICSMTLLMKNGIPSVALAIFVPGDLSFASAAQIDAIQLTYQILEVLKLWAPNRIGLCGFFLGCLCDPPNEPYRSFHREQVGVAVVRIEKIEVMCGSVV